MRIGIAVVGLRPVAEIMTANFSMLAMDQITNNCLPAFLGFTFFCASDALCAYHGLLRAIRLGNPVIFLEHRG